MDESRLNEILRKHALWFDTIGGECGERAALCGADLRGADLRGADLRGAALCGADLRGAALCGADLRGANFEGADLRGAALCGADLRSAIFVGAILSGGDYFKIELQPYTALYIHDYIAIGCKTYLKSEWENFTDAEIEKMDDGAVSWWQKNKKSVLEGGCQ